MLGSVSLPGHQLGANQNKTLKKHGASTCLMISVTYAARFFFNQIAIVNSQLAFVMVFGLCNLLCLICVHSPFPALLALKSLESPLSL